MNTTTIGSAHANAWLHALGHDLPEEIIILPEDGPKRAKAPRKPARSAQPLEQLLEAYPNPAATNQWVVYQLPEGTERATLQVRDVLGRPMNEWRVAGTTGIAEIALHTWPAGIYTATLLADGILLATAKLIVKR